MHEHPLDPTDAFAALGRIKLSETDLPGVLNRISELAQRAIPGAEEVSVTLVRSAGAYTAAFTGQIALTPRRVAVRPGPRPLRRRRSSRHRRGRARHRNR